MHLRKMVTLDIYPYYMEEIVLFFRPNYELVDIYSLKFKSSPRRSRRKMRKKMLNCTQKLVVT